MWKYIRKYLFFAVLAGLFMIGEVMMDRGEIAETGENKTLLSKKVL